MPPRLVMLSIEDPDERYGRRVDLKLLPNSLRHIKHVRSAEAYDISARAVLQARRKYIAKEKDHAEGNRVGALVAAIGFAGEPGLPKSR